MFHRFAVVNAKESGSIKPDKASVFAGALP
jgi:hypothetical protein